MPKDVGVLVKSMASLGLEEDAFVTVGPRHVVLKAVADRDGVVEEVTGSVSERERERVLIAVKRSVWNLWACR